MTNNTLQITVVFTLQSRAEENCSTDKSQMKWSGYKRKNLQQSSRDPCNDTTTAEVSI